MALEDKEQREMGQLSIKVVDDVLQQVGETQAIQRRFVLRVSPIDIAQYVAGLIT